MSLQKYKEYEKDVAIEEIDGLQLVKKLAKNMEEMFHKKSEAVRVSILGSVLCCAETQAAGVWGLALMNQVVEFAHCTNGPSSVLTLGGKQHTLHSSLMEFQSQFSSLDLMLPLKVCKG